MRLFAVLILVLSVLSAPFAHAQVVTLTSPVAPINTAEGDEYSSTVLGNPWDFNEQRDIGWEEGFTGSTIQVNGGIWSAQNKNGGAYVFPLFQGFRESFRTETLPGDTTLPKFGFIYPIDGDKYTYLSFRMRDSNRSVLAIYWNTDTSKPGGWPDGSQFAASQDAYYSSSQGFLKSGFNFYGFDMKRTSQLFEQSGGSWSGDIISFRIDPSTGAPAGSTAEFDWIRLVDPNSALQVPISWTKSGIGNLQNTIVAVYYDTDAAGFDGTPMFFSRADFDPGTLTIPSAALPPGTYYFYVSFFQPGNPGNVYARSAYSAPLTITSAPKVQFLAPSYQSGDDYATKTGNPWDMDGPADVVNLDPIAWPDDWRQFSNPSFDGGPFTLFSATANTPLPGNFETDAQIHLRVDKDNPIDTKKYRYLIYRLWIDSTNFPDMDARVREGWVVRPTWWKDKLFGDGGNGQDAILYEGWHTYVYDLWDPNHLELMLPYQHNDWIYHLRVDPLETAIPTRFSFDFVELRAEPRPDTSNKFQLTFTLDDNDSSNFNVQLYWDTDKSGYNGTLIADLGNQAAGTINYDWNMAGIAAGTPVYVYAVVSDGVNTTKFYAQLPVVSGAYADRIPPEPRVDDPIQVTGVKITPAKLKKKGGTVKITASVTDSSGIEYVTLNFKGGARKINKNVQMKLGTDGKYTGTYKIAAYKSPKKGKKPNESYDVRMFGKAIDGSSKDMKLGRISVAPK